jgi:WD40 repeat protein
LLVLSGHSEPVFTVAFSPDGRSVATGSIDGTARVWDVSPGGGRDALTLAAQGNAPENGALTVAYSPNGRLLVTGGGGKVPAKLWDAATGRELRRLAAPSNTDDATFSPDRRRVLLTGDGDTAFVDDVSSGTTLLHLRRPGAAFSAGAAWSPNGRLLAVGWSYGSATIWDARTGRLLRVLAQVPRTFGPYQGTVARVGFSPDSRQLASASWAGTAKIWDVRSGRLLKTLRQSQNQLNAAELSPQGDRLLTASSDGTAKIWQLPPGRPLVTLAGHPGAVWDAAFSPDGKLVATAGDDTTVRLWNAETGEEILTLTGATFALRRVAFSPDGRRLAAASADGNVRIDILPLDELMRAARARLTRTWTAAECRQYLPGGKCPRKP